MAKRIPSGKPIVGAQRNQGNTLTGLVTFTGSTTVDLLRALKKKGVGRIDYVRKFVVSGLIFEDTGGVATVQRLSDTNNLDGTFTIYAAKESAVAGTWTTATTPCTIRWITLVTE